MDQTVNVAAGRLSHRQVVVSFLALLLGMALAAIDQTIVATALPTIVGDLGGLDHLAWVVTVYLLTETVSTPLWGKLGDLYGRKRLFQGAILIFLAGSMLAGLAGSMGQLIAFRGIQGVGAGGLIVLAQAIIADIVSPRERGRYMGLFGAVFGTTSVIGPLTGGFLTDHLSWRWVFYVNLPLAALALVVTKVVLPPSPRRPRVRVDWLGSGLLAAAISCFVLLTTWGGTEYDWGSPVIVGLGAVSLGLGALFLVVERRATEPTLPLELFRVRTFCIASLISLVMGVAMFGTTTYLPTLLQVANGVSASDSGLLLAPLMLGLLTASTLSGQVVSRTGRYRAFPIIGTALATLGMVLLATLDTGSSRWESGLYMAVLGMGIGFTLQIVVLAIQNETPAEYLGVGTSMVTFFRTVGGSIGVAVFGALFASRLSDRLGGSTTAAGLTPEEIADLPTGERARMAGAVADAITAVFAYAVPLLVITFLLARLLREVPLRTQSGGALRAGASAGSAAAASDGPAGDGAVGDDTAGDDTASSDGAVGDGPAGGDAGSGGNGASGDDAADRRPSVVDYAHEGTVPADGNGRSDGHGSVPPLAEGATIGR